MYIYVQYVILKCHKKKPHINESRGLFMLCEFWTPVSTVFVCNKYVMRKAWIALHKNMDLRFIRQSMVCLLNPWISQCKRRKAQICAKHGLF